MKKIWNQLGHSLFAEDESSRKTKHILKTVFFFYILVLLKVIVFKYPLRGWRRSLLPGQRRLSGRDLEPPTSLYLRRFGCISVTGEN